MKKMLVICLAVVFLLNACGSAASVPKPTIDFQIVASVGINYSVLVETKNSSNRDGLLSVSQFLCKDSDYCYVYFWNDPFYAAISFPLSTYQEQEMVAAYRQNITTGQKELLICSLGEC